MNTILVLGAGELGHAIVTALHRHSASSSGSHSITVTIRQSTLSGALSPSRRNQIESYKNMDVTILPLDIESASQDELTRCFTSFATIIHAGGMTLSPGTQMKVTDAVLASSSSSSSRSKKTYIPWQFGLDYDAIGPSAGGGLFAEQHAIRQKLRAQNHVDWVIVSNGIFTSFLFEPIWGAVERRASDIDAQDWKGKDAEIATRALGSEMDTLVVTTAEDIARATAELVLVDTRLRNRPVFIAGERISYRNIADAVERVCGKNVKREVWSVPELERRLAEDPENKLAKYHVVFASGVGTDWAVETSYSGHKVWKMTGVEEWLRQNWKAD